MADVNIPFISNNVGNIGIGTDNPLELFHVAGVITASVVTASKFKGDLDGTAYLSISSSWSSRSFSSFTSSLALISQNAFFSSQSRWAISASWSSASFNSITSSYTHRSQNSFFASQSQWATSASYASSSTRSDTNLIQSTGSNTTSYLTFVLNTGSYQFTYVTTSLTVNPALGRITATSFTGSHLGNTTGTSSWANNAQSSIYTSQSNWSISSSWASSSVSSITASYALTSSYSFVVESFQTNTISSSYASSSTSASVVETLSPNIINNINNYILTATGGDNINGESQLTYDGTSLYLSGSNIWVDSVNSGSTSVGFRMDAGEGFAIYGNRDFFGSAQDAIIFQMEDINSTGGNTDGGFVFRGYSPINGPPTASNWVVIKSGPRVGVNTMFPTTHLQVDGYVSASGFGSGSFHGTASYSNKSNISNTSLYASQSQWSVSASWASSSLTSITSSYTHRSQNSFFASQSIWSISSSWASSSLNTIFGVSASYASASSDLTRTAYNISVTHSSQSFWATSASYASSSTRSDTILVQATRSNATTYLTFVLNTGSYQNAYVTTSLTVNPALGRITATSFTGSHLGNTIGTSSWTFNVQSSFFSSQSRWSISSSWASSSLTASYVEGATPIFTGKTDNYLPKWSSNTLTGTSNIYDDGTNVGIGTDFPLYSLTIKETSTSAILALIVDNASSRIPGVYLINNNTDVEGTFRLEQSGELPHSVIIEGGTGGSTYTAIKISGSSVLQLMPSVGSVGVATTTPQSKLHIFGHVSASGFGSGSFHGTASYSDRSNVSNTSLFASQSRWATSASYASASSDLTRNTYNISVLFASSSRWAVSSSYASSSTTAVNLGQTAYNISVLYASSSGWSVSASYASSSTNSDYATNAGFASTSTSASHALISNLSYATPYFDYGTNTGSWYQLDNKLQGDKYLGSSERFVVDIYGGAFTDAGTTRYIIDSRDGVNIDRFDFNGGVREDSHTIKVYGENALSTASIDKYIVGIRITSGSFFSIQGTGYNTNLSRYMSWISTTEPDTASLYTDSTPNVITKYYSVTSASSYPILVTHASSSISSSYSLLSLSASYYPAQIYQTNTISASWASRSLSSSYSITSFDLEKTAYNISVLFASQSRWAVSASWASSSVSSSHIVGLHVGNTIGTASWANNSLSSIFASQSRWATSASYASSSTTAFNLGQTAYNISVLYASSSRWSVSASFASRSVSSSWADAANPVFTGKTDNYLPKWSSNTLTGTSNVYDNGTYVGIGTNNPTDLLYVNAVANGSLGINIGDVFRLRNSSGGDNFVLEHLVNGGNLYLRSAESGETGNLIINDVAGNVGIGITNPTNKLYVSGSAGSNIDFRTTGRISCGGPGLGGIWVDGAGGSQFIGSNSTTDIGIWNNGDWRVLIDNAGLVGIGTQNPLYSLHVSASNTNAPALFESYRNDGAIYLWLKNNAYTGSTSLYGFGADQNGGFQIHRSATGSAMMFLPDRSAYVSNTFYPESNGTIDLGKTTNKWNNIYANAFVGTASWATNAVGFTGNGISGYVARWTGTGTLSTGIIRDDGTTAAVGTSPSAVAGLYASRTFSTETASELFGILNGFSVSSTGSGNFRQAYRVNSTIAHAAGTMSNYGDYVSYTQKTQAGWLDNWHNYYAGGILSAGTCSVRYGLRIVGITKSGGYLGNEYGVYIENFTSNVNSFGLRSSLNFGANKYNLYLDGGATNYLSGSVGIGTTNPSARLDVDIGSVGSSANDVMIVQKSGTSYFEVRGDGYVGIGAAPSTLGKIQITAPDTSTPHFSLTNGVTNIAASTAYTFKGWWAVRFNNPAWDGGIGGQYFVPIYG